MVSLCKNSILLNSGHTLVKFNVGINVSFCVNNCIMGKFSSMKVFLQNILSCTFRAGSH